jgi:lipoate---protein ligase
MDQEGESADNFETYTRPILQVLQELGLDARLEGRNDLTIDGKKFSGNAKLVWQGKILQHGTILFSSQMADLSQALQANPLKFHDKAVKSISSRVTNISEHLKEPMELEEFIRRVRDHVHKLYPESRDYEFTEPEIIFIKNLVETKYSTWEWNFGASPQYNFDKSIRTAAGTIEFFLQVEKGKIISIKIYGDFFPTNDPAELEVLLTGLPHKEDALLTRLSELNLSRWFNGVSAEELLTGLF